MGQYTIEPNRDTESATKDVDEKAVFLPLSPDIDVTSMKIAIQAFTLQEQTRCRWPRIDGAQRLLP